VSTEWEFEYPLVIGVFQTIPLFSLTQEIQPSQESNKQFKFELSWFLREGFDERIKEIWTKMTKGRNYVQRTTN